MRENILKIIRNAKEITSAIILTHEVLAKPYSRS